ncbi:ABC transporter ATP-binding protein [Poseidonibacter lekithochrous]|uniref:ABC transporter ATP-binding protein n=1 Tax=Poseidonibacter TaxID=2321187 RepID=UPI001C07FB66|nr:MULTISPECIES: ABC transporter ATP-binding protein [Poseidonibacter]MBU3014236.1 ABC transporter ATP-binding protein [Poseidonibacter lekithochrous]MDO6827533.1 ABC transporter ATP-binding protein [Poseidonibacter sp. 1_MG-2023]
MNKILEIKNITKIYKIYKSNLDRLKEVFFKNKYHKEFISNNNITFDLFVGETLGIIGTNGAGKSTLLKQIAGVVEPTSGEIIRHGRVTALLELGTGFNQELTGYENIFLNGTLIGMSEEECKSKCDEIIAFSELGDYIYEPIMTYSSGMSMRLAFSIALFSEPKILIVDEALSVGDAHFSAKCTKALKKRKEENMSIIYVSHDLNSLKILCDRVILLNHGEVVREGTPEDVINKYNFLIAKLNEDEDKIVISDEQNSNSFGTFDVEILKIEISGSESNSAVISSGENANITIEMKSNTDIENVNIGILIKDRYGQDIFGTTSKNEGFEYQLINNSKYKITFNLDLNIGIGKYTISTALAVGENHLDCCLHWLDHGTNFEIAGIKGSLFTGINKLYPKISKMEKLND